MSFAAIGPRNAPCSDPWGQYSMHMLNKPIGARAGAVCSLSAPQLPTLTPLLAVAPVTCGVRAAVGGAPLGGLRHSRPAPMALPFAAAAPTTASVFQVSHAPKHVPGELAPLALGRSRHDTRHRSAAQRRRGSLPPPSSALDFESLHKHSVSNFSLGGTSKYRGVMRSKRANVWRVKLKVKGRAWYLGSHENEAVAAQAYDAASWFIYDSKAVINFPCVLCAAGCAANCAGRTCRDYDYDLFDPPRQPPNWIIDHILRVRLPPPAWGGWRSTSDRAG
jgi:hypothetical protein